MTDLFDPWANARAALRLYREREERQRSAWKSLAFAPEIVLADGAWRAALARYFGRVCSSARPTCEGG